MNAYPMTAIVILLMSVLQMWMAMTVGNRRRSSGVKAPAMTGDPALERAIRVHGNTVEQLAMFLPALLVCAGFMGDTIAAAIGLVWVIGRVWYAIGYQQAANKREWGFLVTFLALAAALLVGGYGVVMALLG
ncbi:MAG: MAPEG family protein [Lysobacterales bacterium]